MPRSRLPSISCLALLLLTLLPLAAAMAARGVDLVQAQAFFPEADRVGAVEGEPPAAAVYRGGELLGYVFHSIDVAPIPAYSGKPVDVLMGVDTAGIITGAEVIEHHEPILLVGIPEQKLYDFAHHYTGKSVTDRVRVGAGTREGVQYVDAITGATVTVMVVNEVIMQSARKVAKSRNLLDGGPGQQPSAAPEAGPASIPMDRFEQRGWTFLTGNGAIRRLHLTRGQVDQAFAGTEAEGVGTAPPEARDETFIDLYYTYLSAPTIGRNLLGESQYNWLMNELQPGEHAVAIMANGRYSFKGSGYVRGGIFDRLQISQQDRTITFRDLDYYRLSDVYAEGMPRFQEMAIFIIRDAQSFDPGQPWQVELLVSRATGPLESAFTTFSGGYQLPEAYLERPAPPPQPVQPVQPQVAAQTVPATPGSGLAQLEALEAEAEPIWVTVWKERVFSITVLLLGLVVLTLILIFQDNLARRPRLLYYLRTGFLLYTLFFIGWYALAQLSVVNVLTFVNAVFRDFKWDTFLIDPLMFILWSFVAMTLLLWGRGVFCGWLCPFGALQELVNDLARRFKVRQWELPFAVHERLWAVKYLILLGLFGVSLQSMAEAEKLAEVEPFKTAITLRFQREWGFVFYALVLVAISAVQRKAFCRYVCPLGAALAIPARIRLFDWLKRHKECGSPCQICANECEVQAIHPGGQINPNECHYCLDCQVTYWNDRKGPPMIARRKRREKAAGARRSVKRMEEALGAKSGLEEIAVKVEQAKTPGQPSRRPMPGVPLRRG
ncbi:MAG: 4Fe-4S binding protein [Candidatus Competibacteraceae bacterium]|nr:4Fe-4S binding protein [Candidatus Competibacteraceae bacterium]